MDPFLVVALGIVSLFGQIKNYGIDVEQNPHLKNVRVRRYIETQPLNIETTKYYTKLTAFEPYEIEKKTKKQPIGTEDTDIIKLRSYSEPNSQEDNSHDKLQINSQSPTLQDIAPTEEKDHGSQLYPQYDKDSENQQLETQPYSIKDEDYKNPQGAPEETIPMKRTLNEDKYRIKRSISKNQQNLMYDANISAKSFIKNEIAGPKPAFFNVKKLYAYNDGKKLAINENNVFTKENLTNPDKTVYTKESDTIYKYDDTKLEDTTFVNTNINITSQARVNRIILKPKLRLISDVPVGINEDNENAFINKNYSFVNKNNEFVTKYKTIINKNNGFGNKNNEFVNKYKIFVNRNNVFVNKNDAFVYKYNGVANEFDRTRVKFNNFINEPNKIISKTPELQKVIIDGGYPSVNKNNNFETTIESSVNKNRHNARPDNEGSYGGGRILNYGKSGTNNNVDKGSNCSKNTHYGSSNIGYRLTDTHVPIFNNYGSSNNGYTTTGSRYIPVDNDNGSKNTIYGSSNNVDGSSNVGYDLIRQTNIRSSNSDSINNANYENRKTTPSYLIHTETRIKSLIVPATPSFLIREYHYSNREKRGFNRNNNGYNTVSTTYGAFSAITEAYNTYNVNNNGYNNNDGYNSNNNGYNSNNNGYNSNNNGHNSNNYGYNRNNNGYNRNNNIYNGYNSNNNGYNGNNNKIYNPFNDGHNNNQYNGTNRFNSGTYRRRRRRSTTTPRINAASVIANLGCPQFMKNISIFGKKICVPKDNVQDVKESDYYDYD